MRGTRTDSRKYLWYGHKHVPRRGHPRMKEEIGKTEQDVMTWRYRPMNAWFEDEESYWSFFDG